MADIPANKLRIITVPIGERWSDKDSCPDSYTCMIDESMNKAWKRGDDGAIWVNQTSALCYSGDEPKTEWYRVPNSENVLDEDVVEKDWVGDPL